MRRLSLLPLLVHMHIKSQMEYRGAFWIDRIAQIITYSSSFAVIWLLLERFGEMGGWRWPDLALLFSFHLLAYSLGAALSFVQMRELEEHVRLGTLDALLTKPVGLWTYLVFSGLNIGYTGHVILSVGLLAWALGAVDVVWTLPTIAYFVLSLVSAAMVSAALMTLIGATALVWVRSNHLYALFFGFWELSRYPLNIFPGAIQAVMLTVVPLGFAAAVPVAVLLGKPVSLLGDWAGPLGLLAGPFFVALAAWQWRYCVSRYQGAGG